MKKLNSVKLIKLIKGKTVKQVIKLICGEKIGSGLYRDIYILKQNPFFVVKIERNMSQTAFSNACEWRNYINNKEWSWFSKWLAPCELINETGNILIQSRITHSGKEHYPKKIPSLFTDTKLGNFGFIMGTRQFVCCDYSFLLFCKPVLKKAAWWN